jgi:hypothetical protein
MSIPPGGSTSVEVMNLAVHTELDTQASGWGRKGN